MRLGEAGPRPTNVTASAGGAKKKKTETTVSINRIVAEPATVNQRSRRRAVSTMTLRFFAPTVVALAILVGGVFYLDRYRDGLLEAKIVALQAQALVIAAALSAAALADGQGDAAVERQIDPYEAVDVIARFAAPARARARLFNGSGVLIADTRELTAGGRSVQRRALPPSDEGLLSGLFNRAYDWLLPKLPSRDRFPRYTEKWAQHAKDYGEAAAALKGEIGQTVRADANGALNISVAVPVQDLHKVVGALMLSVDSADIEAAVRGARAAVLQAFAVALVITLLLSAFLAGTVERPLRKLAEAADRVRRWRGQRAEIPDMSRRRDEIGDLSVALRDMTAALYGRLDAIEAFAADVAHEIKNPLTSIRSALETLGVSEDPAQREKLFAIMHHDIRRLDRLISDISNASRVDGELARAHSEPVDLTLLLQTAMDIHRTQANGEELVFELDLPKGAPIVVEAVAGRLGQVIDNLLANARSFSPAGGCIRIVLRRESAMAVIVVEDEGSGVAGDQLEAIFTRFYSKRPKHEVFGEHSGLGLSICRQIIDAHGGTIHCENRNDLLEPSRGARFVVRLPL